MPARKAKNKAVLTELGILIASAGLFDREHGGLSIAARVQISILQAHLKAEPLTIKSLALEVNVSVTTLRSYLTVLTDAGLICRSASDRDARRALLHPTQRLLDTAEGLLEIGKRRPARSVAAIASTTSSGSI